MLRTKRLYIRNIKTWGLWGIVVPNRAPYIPTVKKPALFQRTGFFKLYAVYKTILFTYCRSNGLNFKQHISNMIMASI